IGASIMTFVSYVLICIWQYGQNCSFIDVDPATCYGTVNPLDLAVVAAAVAGASFGFLWWNTAPARIFMGDTGSLALGGGIAGLAILSRTELLLPMLAGLFLITSLSVIGQVGSFKLTGRRILRMAPLHHHFEMLGWPEIQIVVRFWIIQGLCIGAGLTVFYAEWVRA
ncbi:MAG: phospho-N-acetylmuramoyl-pentapeptide-transferase, partial [Actinobacteria bacterium]|nr:phospho-N-acetylmuramoyl-pentapeptide-transferase [Actinomycetota bacterium]